jgi:acetyl-CoA acetyltransferase
VLCLAGAAQDSAYFLDRIGRFNTAIGDYLAPHGFGGMNGLFGVIQRKHMETYGTTRAQLGRIAVDQRANARANEAALLRGAMSLEDYLAAPVIAEPLGLYDCVMPCSGAEAILVGPLDLAREEGAGKGVRLRAAGERHNHPAGEVSPLRGGWELFREALYDEAGFGPTEMHFVQAYDDYPIMVAIQLEDLGFCTKGEVGPFLERHRMTWDGSLPLNTGGGQLSCGQSGGGGGMIGLTEAVRQLRGEGSARQVPGARRGLVSGYGMVGYGHGLSASAVVLEAA